MAVWFTLKLIQSQRLTILLKLNISIDNFFCYKPSIQLKKNVCDNTAKYFQISNWNSSGFYTNAQKFFRSWSQNDQREIPTVNIRQQKFYWSYPGILLNWIEIEHMEEIDKFHIKTIFFAHFFNETNEKLGERMWTWIQVCESCVLLIGSK